MWFRTRNEHRLVFCLRIALLGCVLPLAFGATPPTPARPNILFILTDDQGWNTLGCYGNRLVPTPHLDSLARDGLRFTDAYVTPQCTPTRATFLTGQYTARNGLWHVLPGHSLPWAPVREPAFRTALSRDTFTVAKGLRAAGYATALLGKWHLGNNADGHYVALKQEAAAHYGFDFSPPPPHPAYHQRGDKGVDWLTDQALGFIERSGVRPWFCFLAHHTVHGPVVAPNDEVVRQRARGAPETGLHNATYLAALAHLDRSIGRLLARLDALGLREKTLVVFMSDNGGVDTQYDPLAVRSASGDGGWQLRPKLREFASAPLRAGKGSAYEGGIRVPLLARWPGVIPAGGTEGTPVHIVDWAATLLSLAGAPPPPASHPLDGADLTPLLRGRGPGPLAERALFWYMPLYDLRWLATPCAVVREGDFKLVESFGDWVDEAGNYRRGHRLELFDLRRDLGERHDLAPADPARTKALQAKLHAWLRSVGAPLPGPNDNYDPARPLEESRELPRP